MFNIFACSTVKLIWSEEKLITQTFAPQQFLIMTEPQHPSKNKKKQTLVPVCETLTAVWSNSADPFAEYKWSNWRPENVGR